MLKYLSRVDQLNKLWYIFMVGCNCHWKYSQRRCSYMDICLESNVKRCKVGHWITCSVWFQLSTYTHQRMERSHGKESFWNTSGNYVVRVSWIILFSFKILSFFNFSLLHISTWERNILNVTPNLGYLEKNEIVVASSSVCFWWISHYSSGRKAEPWI